MVRSSQPLATNRYSVPAVYAGRTLTLQADDATVRVLDGTREVACHTRSHGRHQRIDDLRHRQDLVRDRRAANAAPIRHHLLLELPQLGTLLERWVHHGRNIGSMVARTKKLRDLYGLVLLRAAVSQMVALGTHDPGALALACEQARRKRGLPIALPVILSPRAVDVEILSPDLASYDAAADSEAAPS